MRGTDRIASDRTHFDANLMVDSASLTMQEIIGTTSPAAWPTWQIRAVETCARRSYNGIG